MSRRKARTQAIEAANELFRGDKSAADRWLNSPARSFNGKTPAEVLKTEEGAQQVIDLVGKIMHGVII